MWMVEAEMIAEKTRGGVSTMVARSRTLEEGVRVVSVCVPGPEKFQQASLRLSAGGFVGVCVWGLCD